MAWLLSGDEQIMVTAKNTEQETNSGIASESNTIDAEQQRRRPNRRTLGWTAAGLALVGLVVAIPFYRHAVSHESTDDAFLDGTIVFISPRVSGHVVKVHVADNQKVAGGDLLIELDPRDFQARLDAARATLHADEAAVSSARAMIRNAQALAAAAKSQQGEARAQVDFAEAALEQAQAEIMAVQAKYEQASQDLKRYRQMAQSNTISPQQLDHAVTADRMAAAEQKAARSKVDTQQSMLKRAEAALKASDDNVHQAQAQVAARQAQAEESKADVEKSRAEVEQAALNLSYAQIHAPIDGYVTRKSADPGTYVQQGQSLMAIVSPQVWVTANFKETQLTHMRPGQPAAISVDTYPDATLHGRVDSIQRGTGSRFSLLPPENATGNFVKVVQRIPVKIVFDRPQELAKYVLVPGMSVIPEINIKADVPATGTQRADARAATP
jgi:membrane fusion protein (multidrug efflux system)